MGRRASSGLNATALIGIAAVVLVLVATGTMLLKKGKMANYLLIMVLLISEMSSINLI